MENYYTVHIFCQKPEICFLIQKTFGHSRYLISSTRIDMTGSKYLDNMDTAFDCVIIDSAINEKIKNKIKDKFKSVPIICLPSLESENTGNGVRYIPEPLRLSELAKALDETLNNKK